MAVSFMKTDHGWGF